MNAFMFSIVTVNLNHCEGLVRTFDSLEAQACSDFEWIVVDGGSSDGSPALLEAWEREWMHWSSEPDGGIYEAMNKGWRRAKGEFVLFLNSGDRLADGRVLAQAKTKLMGGGADFYYGDAYRQAKDGNWIHSKYPDTLNLSQFYQGGLCHQSEFIRRSLLERFSGYDESYRIGADWEFGVRLLLAGVPTEHLSFPVAYYEGGGASQTLLELREEEKTRMYMESVPPGVHRDMQEMVRLRKVLSRLHEESVWLQQMKKRSVLMNIAMVCKWAVTGGKSTFVPEDR